MATQSSSEKPYKCTIEINFSEPLHAQHAMEVLNVDEEIGNRVTKSFAVGEGDQNSMLQV
jgi:hypothetical protein